MKMLNKLGITSLLLFFVCSSLGAEECATANDGCWGGVNGTAYAETCASPCLTPAIALGAIAAVAIVAVVIQNNNSGHSHGHFGHN